MREDLSIVPRAARAPSPSARDLLAVFFRYRRLWLFSFVVCFLAVCVYGLMARSYNAQMKFLVRRGRTDPILAPTVSQTSLLRGEVSDEELNSEVELLRDDEILETVVRNSGLANPGAFRDEDEATRVARAAQRLRRRLEVASVRRTTLISVAYSSSDPIEAARVLRCLAAAYLQRHARVRRPAREADFFDSQVARSRRSLEEIQSELINFSRDEGVVSAALQRDAIIQKLSEAEASYGQIQVSMAETARRIRTLESQLGSLPERTTTQIRSSDNPQLLEKVKSKLLELELKRTELLTKFEPSYRLVREVDQQIADTKASLAAEAQSPVLEQTTEQDRNREWAKAEWVKGQVEMSGLQARSAALNKLLSSYGQTAQRLGDRAIKQEELLRKVKTAEDQYLLYVNKREEARVGDALDQEGILNVSIAQQPTVPALPSRSTLTVGLMGLVFAGTLSTGLVFVADYFDPAFQTPDDVLAYLGTPVLASLPRRNE